MPDGSVIWHGYTRDITDRKLLEEKQNQLMDEVLRTKEALEINLAQKNSLIEEITKTKEQLETAILEKDKFFSIIAHDLRSPFNGFLGLTKLIVEEIENLSKDEVKDLTLSIKNSAESLYALLENLLEWSRIKRGKINFAPLEMDLSLLIKNNISLVKANLLNKEISLHDSIESGLTVFADPNMLNAVVRNLLSNAIKFTRRGGSIYITAVKSTGRMLVTIKDTGIGISEKVLKDLFSVTQKVSQPGTEGESSTGLGLILCKEYIEMHKGKIWVESQVGHGSAFHFTLPNAPKS
jgi:signal transduction histidine kinase